MSWRGVDSDYVEGYNPKWQESETIMNYALTDLKEAAQRLAKIMAGECNYPEQVNMKDVRRKHSAISEVIEGWHD
jgi:hypothetical protein